MSLNRTFKKDLATSLTTFAFLVMAVSGVMMFFHFFDDYVKELHEILGLFFVLVVLSHVFVNLKSLKNYFGKKVFALSAVVITLVSLAFVFNAQDGPDPHRAMIDSMFNSSLVNSSRVLMIELEDVKKRLGAEGIEISDGATISSIADANKISPFEVVGIIIEK